MSLAAVARAGARAVAGAGARAGARAVAGAGAAAVAGARAGAGAEAGAGARARGNDLVLLFSGFGNLIASGGEARRGADPGLFRFSSYCCTEM